MTLGHMLNPAALPYWKRSLDLLCCLAALPFLLGCLVASAVLMSVASRGPLFFRQERVGYRGRRFVLFKLRTMHVAAGTDCHAAHFSTLVHSNTPMRKLDEGRDQRLIPGAWLLRASGLDELPQIINVLRGDMTIVGPRPCIPYEYDHYSDKQRARFESVPGLTGLWQVSGKNRTTFDEMIQLDIEYTTRRSPWLDLAIIARTPFALVVQISDTLRSRSQGRSAEPTPPVLAETDPSALFDRKLTPQLIRQERNHP